MPVTVVVQTGAGVANANAYLSVAAWKTEAEVSGWDYTTTPYTDAQIGAAIIRGRRWLDLTYRSRWPGEATAESQTTAWPRSDVVTDVGLVYPDDNIPQDIIDANAEAAWRELQSPGSLSPDQERGGAIKSLKAGSVEIVYADGATAGTVFVTIDNLVGSWLLPAASATTVSWPLRA